MKKLMYLFLSFFLNVNLLSVLLISIPKSGTHLLFKTVKNITNKDVILERNTPSYLGDHGHNLYNITVKDLDFYLTLHQSSSLHSHLKYTKESEDLLLNKEYKVLFNMRDPRDLAVARAYWIKALPEYFPGSIDQTLQEILTNNIVNIANFYNTWLPWMDYPYVLTIRFEDLVGSKGRGNDSRQLATVKAIAKHLSVELSEERAQEIATDLFGITKNTFRKGQIGAWKHEFTAEHKELFKQYGGELLIKLGYEKDLNW